MTTTIALVTGGNKGIGRAVVRRLAGLGWTVVLAARDAGLTVDETFVGGRRVESLGPQRHDMVK